MNLLTYDAARTLLWNYAEIGVELSQASLAQLEEFRVKLNQVVSRYLDMLKPALTYVRFQVPIYDNYITLPRGCQSLLGIRPVNDQNCACSPLAIYSRFHEFAQTGASTGCFGYWCAGGGVLPTSETTQTFRDPTPGFTLKITADASGGTMQFFGGYDEDWDEYFDSVQLSIIDGSDVTTRVWNSMPRVLKSTTTGAVQLYAVDSTTAEETLIAVYAPGETAPAYQRYKLPSLPNNIPVARILTRMTFVELTADTDIVFPSNIGALKMGLKALNYEDKDDVEREEERWQKGIRLIELNKQEIEGDAQIPLVDAAYGFGASTVPNII